MPKIYIGIGSNHNAEANINAGVKYLSDILSLVAVSPYYRSPPASGHGAPYVNAVACVESKLEPQSIKAELKRIEDAIGRDRTQKAQINLDLDLLLYGDFVGDYTHSKKTYYLPDPEILTRVYVAYPLAILDYDLLHPETKRFMSEIVRNFGDDIFQLKRVRWMAEGYENYYYIPPKIEPTPQAKQRILKHIREARKPFGIDFSE